MLSRVANAIYWMNRYIERADNYSRFLDVNFNLSLELHPDVSQQWGPLVVTTGDWDLYNSLYDSIEKRNVIFFLGFSPKNPNSILNCIINARENARAVRPEITKEVWEQINYLYYHVKKGAEKKLWQKKDPRAFFTEIKKGCQLLYGIFESTISRTDGWHFGKIGQLIERADKTSRILDVKYHILLPTPEAVGSPLDLIQWAALLKSVSAYDMYRKKNGKLTPLAISKFLIRDDEFPRSMLRSLIQAELSLKIISENDGRVKNEALEQIEQLRSQIEQTNLNQVFETGLHEYIDQFQTALNKVTESVYSTFFSIEQTIEQSQQQ